MWDYRLHASCRVGNYPVGIIPLRSVFQKNQSVPRFLSSSTKNSCIICSLILMAVASSLLVCCTTIPPPKTPAHAPSKTNVNTLPLTVENSTTTLPYTPRPVPSNSNSTPFGKTFVPSTTTSASSLDARTSAIEKNTDEDNYNLNIIANKSPFFLRIIRTPPPDIELEAGRSVRLRCEFEGAPQPIRLRWFRNEVPLDEHEEPHRIAVVRRQSRQQAATQLRISRLSVHDTAFYRCEATTDHNHVQATTVLRVHATDLIQPPSSRGSESGDIYAGSVRELTVPDFSLPDFDATGAEIIDISDASSIGGGGESGGGVNIERLLDRSEYGMCMPYAGRECVRELGSEQVFVQSTRAMTQLEERVTAALALYSGGLGSSPGETQRCPLSIARRALCVHVFPPCRKASSSSAVAESVPEAIEMCRDQCDLLQGDLCQQEFQLASQHVLLSPLLPKCELLDFTSKDNFIEPEVKCVSLGLMPSETRQDAVDKHGGVEKNQETFSDEKCYTERGSSYRGTASTTNNNAPCRQWDALIYRQHAGHNFCRNSPDAQRFDKPWCISSATNLPTACRIEKCIVDTIIPFIKANVETKTKRPSTAAAALSTPVTSDDKKIGVGFFTTPRNAYIIGGLVAGLLVFFMALGGSIFCRRKSTGSSLVPGGVASFHHRAANKHVRAMEERKAAYWGTNALPYELNAFLPSSAEPSVAATAAVAAVKALSVSSGSSYSHEVPLKCLRFLECLGTGRFGKIYLGEMVAPQGGPRAIMVKTLLSPDRLYLKDEFYRQVTQWNDLLHPNVVSIIGINVREEPNCAVFEHSRIGDLHEFITSPAALATLNNTQLNGINPNGMLQPCHNEAFSSSSADSASSSRNNAHGMRQPQINNSLDVNDKLRIAQQIAEGLDYLHSRGYNHADLACRSCIVFEQLIVKVADYGIGHELYPDDYYECDDGTQLPLRWMSPEAITYRAPPHQTSNVWSFGVLLWELFTNGKRPYSTLSNLEALDAVQTRQLLPCPTGDPNSLASPPQVYALMIECWHCEPAKRPTFKQLAASRIRQCQQEVAHAAPTVLDSACSSTKWQHAIRGGGVRGASGSSGVRSQSQASHSNSSSNSGVGSGGAVGDQQSSRLPFLMNCGGGGTPANARATATHQPNTNLLEPTHFPLHATGGAIQLHNTPQQQPHPMALRGRLGVQNRYLPAAATSSASSSFAASVASPRMLPRHIISNQQQQQQQQAPSNLSLLDFHHQQHQQQPQPVTVMYNTLNRNSHARSSTQSNSHYQNQNFNAAQHQSYAIAVGAGNNNNAQEAGAIISLINSSNGRSQAAYYSNCQYNGIILPTTEAPA